MKHFIARMGVDLLIWMGLLVLSLLVLLAGWWSSVDGLTVVELLAGLGVVGLAWLVNRQLTDVDET